ncbi:hypothetical protein SALBM311S_09581 [Streptomyces alboniger]
MVRGRVGPHKEGELGSACPDDAPPVAAEAVLTQAVETSGQGDGRGVAGLGGSWTGHHVQPRFDSDVQRPDRDPGDKRDLLQGQPGCQGPLHAGEEGVEELPVAFLREHRAGVYPDASGEAVAQRHQACGVHWQADQEVGAADPFVQRTDRVDQVLGASTGVRGGGHRHMAVAAVGRQEHREQGVADSVQCGWRPLGEDGARDEATAGQMAQDVDVEVRGCVCRQPWGDPLGCQLVKHGSG